MRFEAHSLTVAGAVSDSHRLPNWLALQLAPRVTHLLNPSRLCGGFKRWREYIERVRGSQFTAPNRSQLLEMTGAVIQVGRAEVGRRGREKGQREKKPEKGKPRAKARRDALQCSPGFPPHPNPVRRASVEPCRVRRNCRRGQDLDCLFCNYSLQETQ